MKKFLTPATNGDYGADSERRDGDARGARIEIRCTESQKALWVDYAKGTEHGDLSKLIRAHIERLIKGER